MYFHYGSQDEIAQRRDLRDITICSVDPPGCTDIDDALHCKPLPNGNFEVHTMDFTTVIEYRCNTFPVWCLHLGKSLMVSYHTRMSTSYHDVQQVAKNCN